MHLTSQNPKPFANPLEQLGSCLGANSLPPVVGLSSRILSVWSTNWGDVAGVPVKPEKKRIESNAAPFLQHLGMSAKSVRFQYVLDLNMCPKSIQNAAHFLCYGLVLVVLVLPRFISPILVACCRQQLRSDPRSTRQYGIKSGMKCLQF